MARGVTAGLRCPICGEGVLASIAYDEHEPELPLPKQAPQSREVLAFSCGHDVEDRLLAEAARNDPNVERRSVEETVMPIDPDGGSE